MPGFFSRNIHLTTKSFNCFTTSSSRDSSSSNSTRSAPGLSWSKDSGGTTSSTESTATRSPAKVNNGDSSLSSSNHYRQLRSCKEIDLSKMSQQQQKQNHHRTTETNNPSLAGQTRRSIVSEPGDDWGHFVDFRSPEQNELKRKSFVGERLPPHPE